MMNAKGAIKEVQTMSEEVGDPIKADDFIGAVAGYYPPRPKASWFQCLSTARLLFFTITRTPSKKAGLDPEKPPKTWEEVAEGRS